MTTEKSTSTTTTTARSIWPENVQVGALEGYLARPAEGENLPALIVIHEIFGLNDDIRDIANRFAAEGYVALAVDLFSHGNRAACVMRVVINMIRNPLQSFSMYDLDEAVKFLKVQPGVAPDQIGVIGFCMGGSYAMALAVHNQEVKAASIFYGQNPKPITELEKACPIVGSYGENDKMFSKQGRQLEQVMQQYGKPVDVKIYPNAGHSFFNKNRLFHRPEAAADAWQRTLSWFHQYLPKGSAESAPETSPEALPTE